jgi:hypothetical protein
MQIQMGSVVCPHCGYIRWDAAVHCPACGAESREILGPTTGLVKSWTRRRRRPVVDTSASEVRVQKDPKEPDRRLRLAAGVGGVAVIGVLLVYFLLNGAVGSEVLIPQGSTTEVPQGGDWTLDKGGTLRGSFSVTNGSAEICFANFDMFDYAVAHGLSFNQCPSNATYSSGFVASGTLSGTFGAGNIYLQTFISPGWTDSQPRPSVTWTGAVAIQPS